MLEADRQKSGGSLPSLPVIRLANKDATQAPEGHYFVETRKGKDEKPDIRVIGPNPEIIVLYKTATYSYFTKQDGLIAWTTDIHGYTDLDRVALFVKKGGKVCIEKDAPYPEFKAFIKQKYVTMDPVTGKTQNLLKFKTVLYVLFEGKPHKMFVSNASSAGVDEEGLPSFDAPQMESLQLFTDQCWSDQRAMYEFKLELGSRLIQSSKPFYIMLFRLLGTLDETQLRESLHAAKNAEKAIMMIDNARRAAVNSEAITAKDVQDEFGSSSEQ